jgi:hypothetical protein
MPRDLFKFCISTIIERRRLEEFALKGRANFAEGRAWKTGKLLFEQSRKAGASLPVILSDAAYNSEDLLLWGILQKLEIDGERTAIHLNDIKRVRGNHGRQDLKLKSTGKPIRPNFIRPYAICHTPPFLK